MKITVTKDAGYCFGVRDAVNMAYDASGKFGEVYMLGSIVHNEKVVKDLEEAGTKTVSNLNEVPTNSPILFRAHGTVGKLWDEAKSKNMNIIDATCPLVYEIHREVKKLSKGLENIGVKRVIEYISKYMPSASTIHVKCDSNADLQAFVFKTINEEHVGELSFFKVFSGSMKTGDVVQNINLSSNEKIRQMYYLTGKNRVEVSKIPAGDIGVTLKLKDTHTGNTLVKGSGKKINNFTFPTPILNLAVEPKTRGDEDKISLGLSSLHQYDPTFIYKFDPELKQTIVSGYGDMHLKLAFEKIKGQFGVDVNLLKPKIPYRETITSNAQAKYRHKKQSGGAGQFAEVWLRINPTERGEGIDFGQSLSGQNVDRGFVPSVEKGIKKICDNGIIAGCNDEKIKSKFNLNSNSNVLLIGCEGDTDQEMYQKLLNK